MNSLKDNYRVKDKKAAILTRYYRNYNGLLQSYALQKSIDKLGYQAKQISYVLESGYSSWKPIKSKIKKTIAYLYHKAKYGKWFDYYMTQNK